MNRGPVRTIQPPMTTSILLSEVGPRDGLQSVNKIMPTAAKRVWIDALVAAGIQEIEVASFVPARMLPQMADAAQVVRHAVQHKGLTVMALAPNLRGAARRGIGLGRRCAQAHHPGVGQRRALFGQRAPNPRAEGGRGAQDLRFAQ